MFWTLQRYLQVSKQICWTPFFCKAISAKTRGKMYGPWRMDTKAVFFKCVFFSICFFMPLILNVFVSWLVWMLGHKKLPSSFYKASAIPAIEVLGKAVSKRTTWFRRPSSKVRRLGRLTCNKIPKMFRFWLVNFEGFFHDLFFGENQPRYRNPMGMNTWFRAGAIGSDWTRFDNPWLLECLTVLPLGLVPSTWCTCVVEVPLLLLLFTVKHQFSTMPRTYCIFEEGRGLS